MRETNNPLSSIDASSAGQSFKILEFHSGEPLYACAALTRFLPSIEDSKLPGKYTMQQGNGITLLHSIASQLAAHDTFVISIQEKETTDIFEALRVVLHDVTSIERNGLLRNIQPEVATGLHTLRSLVVGLAEKKLSPLELFYMGCRLTEEQWAHLCTHKIKYFRKAARDELERLKQLGEE